MKIKNLKKIIIKFFVFDNFLDFSNEKINSEII